MKPLRFPDRIGKFQEAWLERLHVGQQVYGDASFRKSTGDLLDEIQQECVDLAGWGYVLWLKCEQLREKL